MDKEMEKILEAKIQEHRLKCRNKCWCKKCENAIKCVDGCRVCIVRKTNKHVVECFMNKDKNIDTYIPNKNLRGNK